MKNKLFIVSILLILVYCLSAIYAADVNSTSENLEIEEDGSLELSGVDEFCDDSSVCNEKSNCVNSACDTLSTISDNLTVDEDRLGFVYDNYQSANTHKKSVVNFYMDNTNDFFNMFLVMDTCNPRWQVINITLAPNTVINSLCIQKCYGANYMFNGIGKTFIIHGNPGSVIHCGSSSQ